MMRSCSRLSTPVSRLVASPQQTTLFQKPFARPTFYSRQFSSHQQGSVAIAKLRTVLEEYRKKNYAQCLPMRFKKELIRAAASKENADHIAVEGMVRVLHNIGSQDHLSPSEIQQIFEEHGNGNEISVARLVQLI